MKILLPDSDVLTINIALAREVGLYEATILLKIHRTINSNGVKHNGLLSIARTKKELLELFPWVKGVGLLDKVLERLINKGYLLVDDNTLFDDKSAWYSLNENKLREIKSLTILSEEEISAEHIAPVKVAKVNGDQQPAVYKALYAAFLKICHWDKAPLLSPRDRAEIGNSAKALIKKYPDRDIDALVAMLLGFETYRTEVLKATMPFRPFGVMRCWQQYSDYCVKNNRGEPLSVKESS